MVSVRGSWIATILGLAVFAAFPPLSAQQPPSLAPGQRVRVTAPAAGLVREVGTLDAVSADSVVLLQERHRYDKRWSIVTVRTAVPRTALQALEISVGRRTYVKWAGLGIGLAVGAAVGGMLGNLVHDSNSGFGPQIGSGVVFVMSFVTFGGIGAAVGASIGRDIWAAVPLDGLRVGMTPLPAGRLGLGASLAF
jgi:hypothetical protein